MPLQFQIDDDDVKYLNHDARTALLDSIRKYGTDVLDEALRLEATAGSQLGNPQVTSGIIEDADLVLRKGYRKPKKSARFKRAQIAAIFSTFVAGLLADYSFLQEPLYLVLFVLSIVISLSLAIFLLFAE